MPTRRLPTSFTSTRALQVGATAVARGATVSAGAAARALGQKLGLYVSRGWLLPDVTQYVQTARRAGLGPLHQRHYPPVAYNSAETRQMQKGT